MTVQINAVAEPVLESDEISTPAVSTDKRRKTPTPESKQLKARIEGFNESKRTVDSKFREGFHKPGSQNRNK